MKRYYNTNYPFYTPSLLKSGTNSLELGKIRAYISCIRLYLYQKVRKKCVKEDKVMNIPKDKIKQREINGISYYVYRWKSNGISKTIYAKTIKELNTKYGEYLKEDKEIVVHKKSPNFNTLFESYLEEKKREWKIQTYISKYNFYKTHLKKSKLSKMQITDIKKGDILNFINDLNLTYSTKKEKLNQLGQFFNWCIENEYINKNICKSIKIKQPFKEEEALVNESIVKAILDDCRGLEIESVIILLCNGCRLGESLGANRNAIKGNYILINESLTKVSIEGKTTYLLEPPKNNHSIRKLYLSEEHIKRLLNCSTNDKGYFSNIKGKWISRKRIYGFLNKYGVKPHDLRKFYCSYLLMNGTNVYAVKAQLGHSKASQLTESVYLQTGNYIEKEMQKYF